MEKYYLTNERGERMGDGTYIGTDAFPLSPEDQRTVDILRALPTVTRRRGPPSASWGGAAFLPGQAEAAVGGAAAGLRENLPKRPGLYRCRPRRGRAGQLCASFEAMRAALAQNFSEMWRQMEERKRLNAAFAHDLRTPLTVLKGYNEMLQASGDEQTRTTAITMQRHISRLENYVDTMSHLRRLEDTQPTYRQTPLKALAASLYESGTIICERAEKHFFNAEPNNFAGSVIGWRFDLSGIRQFDSKCHAVCCLINRTLSGRNTGGVVAVCIG